MNEYKYFIEGDIIYRQKPTLSNDVYYSEPMMDKETFIKAYKLWIDNQSNDKEVR